MVSYEYQCSVCNFSVRLGNTLLALEAAHIKWHQAGGPDLETNGLALCSIHHKLFDRGAFTLSDSLIIEVSEQANGANGFQEWLISFHGKPMKRPQNPNNNPNSSFLSWHRKEVFRGPSRFLAC
ncbi:MAG: HNH endonuclease [Blastocatellia bacterium]